MQKLVTERNERPEWPADAPPSFQVADRYIDRRSLLFVFALLVNMCSFIVAFRSVAPFADFGVSFAFALARSRSRSPVAAGRRLAKIVIASSSASSALDRWIRNRSFLQRLRFTRSGHLGRLNQRTDIRRRADELQRRAHRRSAARSVRSHHHHRRRFCSCVTIVLCELL